jgi:glycosyltransferase involved in cell wall biosynthesis
MFTAAYDADAGGLAGGEAEAYAGPLRDAWSIIVPFFNEKDYLPRCIESLSKQSVKPLILLIDNGSTDRSAEVATKACEGLKCEAKLFLERRPGKVAALQRGLAEVSSEFVATCDADTLYPADYLEQATRLLRQEGVVAAIAATSVPAASAFRRKLAGLKLALTAKLLPQQCLRGGAGQVFRTSALRACGGFDPAIWNWVLEDHEIMARIERLGRLAYHRDFHCYPENRPRGTNCRGWSLGERLRYHLAADDRLSFFHNFLGPRLRQRALSSEKLRRTGTRPLHA